VNNWSETHSDEKAGMKRNSTKNYCGSLFGREGHETISYSSSKVAALFELGQLYLILLEHFVKWNT